MAVTINASTTAGLVQTADTSGVLQLQTAGTTAVTVDASQNVGIGTASPIALLDVAGTIRLNHPSAGTALTVRSNSAGSGSGAQILMTDTWASNPAPSKFMRINSFGDWQIVNSAYSQGIFSVSNAGVADATAGFSKNGTAISSIVFADVSITNLTTSFQEKVFTLPNGIDYGAVVAILPLAGANDIVTIDYISLGEWFGVQLSTQGRVGIKLGHALASTTGTIRVYYRI